MARGFTLFDTAIGRCGLAWDDSYLVAVRLPARDDSATAASLRKHSDTLDPSAPPPFAAKAINVITTHLAGGVADLASLPIDFSRVGAFDRDVLRTCRAIPSGATRTYGEIARDLGDQLAARAVGAALGRNPWPIIVPCHRVVAANGKLGGFSAPGGRTSKVRLLEIERASRGDGAPELFDAPTQRRA